MKKAVNIQWAMPSSSFWEEVSKMSDEDKATLLRMTLDKYNELDKNALEDYLFDVYWHHFNDVMAFIGLPDEVNIPKELENETKEDITYWLMQEYGCYVHAFDFAHFYSNAFGVIMLYNDDGYFKNGVEVPKDQFYRELKRLEKKHINTLSQMYEFETSHYY